MYKQCVKKVVSDSPGLVDFAIGLRGGSSGRVQGVCTPPLPEMTCGFLIQLVFCKKKKLSGLLVLK